MYTAVRFSFKYDMRQLTPVIEVMDTTECDAGFQWEFFPQISNRNELWSKV